jgi:hypothetical protein
MKFLRDADIWPSTNNGVLVEKENTDGSTYQVIISKEEYELESFLLGVEEEGITELHQVEELRKLIEEYGSLQYSRGYDNCEQNMNDC